MFHLQFRCLNLVLLGKKTNVNVCQSTSNQTHLLKRGAHSLLINYASSVGDPCASHRSTINNVKESSVSSVTKTTTKQFHLQQVYIWVHISFHYIENLVLQRLVGSQIDRVLTRTIQETFSTYQRCLLLLHSFTFSYALLPSLPLPLSFSRTHMLDCYKCCL